MSGVCSNRWLSRCFLQDEIENNHDLIATYRHYITATMNQANVSQFLRSYNSRNALEVERPIPGGNINARTLKLGPIHHLLSHHRDFGGSIVYKCLWMCCFPQMPDSAGGRR